MLAEPGQQPTVHVHCRHPPVVGGALHLCELEGRKGPEDHVSGPRRPSGADRVQLGVHGVALGKVESFDLQNKLTSEIPLRLG